jgi:hypothetical protein
VLACVCQQRAEIRLVIGANSMPIRTLLDDGAEAFWPEDVEAMVSAFEATLSALGLVERTDPAVRMVAERVVYFAKEGERDPIVLRDRVLESFNNGASNLGR